MTPWRFSVPGQPPSVNHLYKPTMKENAEGTYRGFRKAEGVETYQTVAALSTKMAIPKEWKQFFQRDHTTQVRVSYYFHLAHDIDCSNAFKALEDAIAQAMGIDDKRFLPCAAGKDTGNKEPWVDIEISLPTTHTHPSSA